LPRRARGAQHERTKERGKEKGRTESNVATRPAWPGPSPRPRRDTVVESKRKKLTVRGSSGVRAGTAPAAPARAVWTRAARSPRGGLLGRPATVTDSRAPGLPACATCRAGSAPFPHSGSGRGVIYPALTHRAGTPGTPCRFGSKYFEKAPPPPPLPSASRSDPSERNNSYEFEAGFAASPCELRDFPEVLFSPIQQSASSSALQSHEILCRRVHSTPHQESSTSPTAHKKTTPSY